MSQHRVDNQAGENSLGNCFTIGKDKSAHSENAHTKDSIKCNIESPIKLGVLMHHGSRHIILIKHDVNVQPRLSDESNNCSNNTIVNI